MQIERLFANSTVSKKRRPSYITVNSVSPSSVETLLSTRTAKSISKSRRSSLVAEVLGSSPSSERTTSTNGCPDVGVLIGSRRSSLINVVYDKSSFPEGEYNFPPTDESMNGDNETPSDFFLDHPYEQLDPIPSFPSSPITQPPSSTERAPRSRSLSITPIIQETSSMHISKTVHLDDHTMYKVKKKRPSSSDTVASNPALSAQEDVPIQDIKTDGLSAMLDSKVPLCYFLHHLLEEYSSENLFFFLELQQYDYTSGSQQLASAQHIYDIYLSRNSPFEVNLDDKVRSDITVALDEQNVQGCFQTAKRAVFLLLESSFMQFIRTETWNQMVDNCGGSTMERREKAVDNLIVYLEKSTRSPHHTMIKTMVHEFCRTLLGVEFEYYRSDEPRAFLPQQRRGLKHKHVLLFDFFGKKRLH